MSVLKEKGNLRRTILNLYHNTLCSTREGNNKRLKFGQKIKSQKGTSSCINSQTRLRSAMDGWFLPSKKRPLPLSQKDSSFERDEDRIISASAATCGFNGRPSIGAIVVLKTYGAEKRIIEFKSLSYPRKGTFICITK